MLFNSFEFLIFFPVVVTLYFLTPHRFKWILLLAASYFFYMWWEPAYILLILLSTVIDFGVGQKISKIPERSDRKPWLILSLATNLGLLFTFKYFNFFNAQIASLAGFLGLQYQISDLSVLLPVGISFYTFQTLSYTIDLYKGQIEPERHFGKFALFVAFFPQLVAGPIERAKNLLNQFHKEHEFNYSQVVSGLKLMVWGLFKKVVLADRLAVFVDIVYNTPTEHSPATLVLATYFFAFQIYCDFSGYSDIAIGAARVMGYDLMLNFNRPYLARTVSDFWKRWHISLSTWFRDYLYIPLGGNRVSVPKWYANLLITFLVSGLWHGANWTFVAWGALHGGYLVFAILFEKLISKSKIFNWKKSRPNLGWFFDIVVTFHLALFAWIFFRANSISDAFYIIGSLPNFNIADVYVGTSSMFGYSLIGLFVLTFVEFRQEFYKIMSPYFDKSGYLLRYASYAFYILLILSIGVFDGGQFIYFQF